MSTQTRETRNELHGDVTTKPLIGVIGLGAVGGALSHVLSYFYGDSVVGYDIRMDYSWLPILETEATFICVQTPEEDGRLDCSRISKVASWLDEDGYKGIVVVKSTVGLGFMAELSTEFPRLRFVYSPEFLREKSSLQWSACPDRLVFSGNEADVKTAMRFFSWVEDAEIIITDHKTAEMGKLAHNAYIATKVSFTNEMQRIALENGADPSGVMDIVIADRRVKSPEHLRPFLGPYGGKCVPKDTRELMNAAGGSVLLAAVEKVNDLSVERESVREEPSVSIEARARC